MSLWKVSALQLREMLQFKPLVARWVSDGMDHAWSIAIDNLVYEMNYEAFDADRQVIVEASAKDCFDLFSWMKGECLFDRVYELTDLPAGNVSTVSVVRYVFED